MTRLPIYIATLTLTLGGCAVIANVTPIGDGAFATAAHSNDVNARVEQETAQAMSQAAAYCKEHGAAVDVRFERAPDRTIGREPDPEADPETDRTTDPRRTDR